MSNVRRSERHESKVQYVDTARELVVHTMAYVKKFPKSTTFILNTKMVEVAQDIYINVVTAQDTFPKSAADVDRRRGYLQAALGLISSLDCFVDMAISLHGNLKKKDSGGNDKLVISEYGWLHWGELLDKERNLIKAVLQSDEKITF